MIEQHGLEVDLQITNRCPLDCDHCVYDSSMREGHGLPFELMERLCGEFEELGVSQVSITGGEPFIRRDLLDVVSMIARRNIEVCVQTSGLMVDRTDFAKLRDSGLDLLLVSIDGLPAYHDQFRHHRGIFEDATQTVARAVSHGIPVRINSVVTRSNIADAVRLLPIAQALGVEVFSFFYFSPLGRGSLHPQEVLSFSEWRRFEGEVADWCLEHNRPAKMGVKVQTVAVAAADLGPETQRCRIRNRDNILILAGGEVYPCVFVCHDQDLCIGNVYKDSLVSLWRDSPRWNLGYDPLFQILGRDCASHVVEGCTGGCPAFRKIWRSADGNCDRRCEWETSGLVPGCAREYTRM